MKKSINEIEYLNNCYKCKKPSNLSLCKNCEKEYNKTWYYTITRKKTWPENLVSGHAIRIFGIYLFSILKIAKPNYEWSCSKSYSEKTCKCPKHINPSVINLPEKYV